MILGRDNHRLGAEVALSLQLEMVWKWQLIQNVLMETNRHKDEIQQARSYHPQYWGSRTGSQYISGPKSRWWFWLITLHIVCDLAIWKTVYPSMVWSTCAAEEGLLWVLLASKAQLMSTKGRDFSVAAPLLWNFFPKDAHLPLTWLVFQHHMKKEPLRLNFN